MQFNITEKPSECEVVRNGVVVGKINFNAYDVATRGAFFSLYNEIVTKESKVFSADVDKFGVPLALEKATTEAKKTLKALSQGIDKVFGKGTAKLLTDGNKDATVLLEFLAFASNEFRIATGVKIDKYIKAQESDVLI